MTYLWAYLVAFVRLFAIMAMAYYVASTLLGMDLRSWIGPFWYIGAVSALAGPIGLWINRMENEK
jgi:hypothetical protein